MNKILFYKLHETLVFGGLVDVDCHRSLQDDVESITDLSLFEDELLFLKYFYVEMLANL